MKKRIIQILIMIMILILLFPQKIYIKDGGSVMYKSLVYTITKYHQLDESSPTHYRDGLEVVVLGMSLYNSFHQ